MKTLRNLLDNQSLTVMDVIYEAMAVIALVVTFMMITVFAMAVM